MQGSFYHLQYIEEKTEAWSTYIIFPGSHRYEAEIRFELRIPSSQSLFSFSLTKEGLVSLILLWSGKFVSLMKPPSSLPTWPALQLIFSKEGKKKQKRLIQAALTGLNILTGYFFDLKQMLSKYKNRIFLFHLSLFITTTKWRMCQTPWFLFVEKNIFNLLHWALLFYAGW